MNLPNVRVYNYDVNFKDSKQFKIAFVKRNLKSYKNEFFRFVNAETKQNNYSTIISLLQLQMLLKNYEVTNEINKELMLTQLYSIFDLEQWEKSFENYTEFLVRYFLKSNKTIDIAEIPTNLRNEKGEQILVKGFKITELDAQKLYDEPYLKRKEILAKEKVETKEIDYLIKQGLFVPVELTEQKSRKKLEHINNSNKKELAQILNNKICVSKPLLNIKKDKNFYNVYSQMVSNEFLKEITDKYVYDYVDDVKNSYVKLHTWSEELDENAKNTQSSQILKNMCIFLLQKLQGNEEEILTELKKNFNVDYSYNGEVLQKNDFVSKYEIKALNNETLNEENSF